MLEIGYDLFIAPIVMLMKLILDKSSYYTDNLGLSIIMLSLIFNIILLPFYHIAEKTQSLERSVQKKMKPKIDEFKAVFSGQELHMMLRTLYRQNNYHPISGLKSLLPLVLQIPVFIAAFYFLSNYQAFEGESFFIFEDLSQQDKLFNNINVLPVVMTAINLWAGFVYTKGLAKNEKIQVVIIALVFLFLLYESPAALVLYWTFNNVFSLIKNYMIYENL